jgi:hypothetical protein
MKVILGMALAIVLAVAVGLAVMTADNRDARETRDEVERWCASVDEVDMALDEDVMREWVENCAGR